MFDFFRNNMKFLMGLLMLLIIPSFVLFGIEGYSSFREGKDVVAKVGKGEITRQEWDAAHRNEADRLAASMPGVDRSLLDSEAARQGTLERLVNERVLSLAAEDGLLLASDQRLARELTQDPAIAALRRPDGTLDVERYQQLLRGQGMTPEMFEASVRADLARRQVLQGVEASSFLTQAAGQTALRAFFERREIQWAAFRPVDYKGGVQVSDDEVKRFYDANADQFRTMEQADVEYLLLDLEAVAQTVMPSDSELRAYYDQNNARLAQQEQRRARHILLTIDPKSTPEDKAKVRAEAQALLQQLRAAPERFAELARTRSQDPGSAAQGGDLDFFGRGAMVKPFEDAAYALAKGAISDVVETEFGFHIIQVTDVRQPKPEPFEQVKAKLQAELSQQVAQRRFAEVAEEFTNLVYEHADNFNVAAERLKLTPRRLQNVQRTGPADGTRHPALSQPKVLAAIFQEEALRQKRNSEAIELGSNQMVSVRVLAHRPSEVQPLEVVAAQVRERLRDQKALEAARQDGQARLAAWQAAPATAALQPAVVVSREDTKGLPPALVTAALSAAAGPSTAAWTAVDLGAEGYAVIRINRVLERPSVDQGRSQQERDQLTALWARAEAQAFLQSLRNRYKVQIIQKKAETAG